MVRRRCRKGFQQGRFRSCRSKPRSKISKSAANLKGPDVALQLSKIDLNPKDPRTFLLNGVDPEASTLAIKTKVLPAVEPCEDKDDDGLEIKRCRRLHVFCRHRCNGVAGEMFCLPCLDPACIPVDSNLPRNDELCSICYTSELVDQPCVRLSCGHVFHADCVLNLLRHKWSTMRITFAFLNCPSCKKPIELAKNATGCSLIKQELDKMYQLKHAIERQALVEAKNQGLDKDERLKTEGDYYYRNLQEYAMHACAFYECYECKGHYFGGMIDCIAEQGMEDNSDRKDFRCKPCILKACKVGMKKCEVHGSAHIDWKCNFCCSVALYHCFGTTYFCKKHHDDGNPYNPIVEKCKGGADCPLGIEHPPNSKDLAVSTFPIGCGLCRSSQDRRPKPVPVKAARSSSFGLKSFLGCLASQKCEPVPEGV